MSKNIIWAVSGIAAVGLLTACSGDGGSDRAAAEVMCQEFVGKEFGSDIEHSSPFNSEGATENGDNEWTYDGGHPADSPRIEYTCVVSTEDDDTWTLESLTER